MCNQEEIRISFLEHLASAGAKGKITIILNVFEHLTYELKNGQAICVKSVWKETKQKIQTPSRRFP